MQSPRAAGGVQGQMARGAVWMVLFKLLERSIGLVSTLILARVLIPADFGIVAMAMTFIAMAELLTAFGFDIALIQNRDASVDDYNTAWTGNLLLGLAIMLAMLAAAVPISQFYREPELVSVVALLALGPAISGAENIGVVAFRKELSFRREFVFQLSRKLIGFSVVVPLAFLLQNHWALVAGTLASKLAATVISYLMHPFRPRPSLKRIGELFHFSKWILLHNVVAFARERSSDFFVGRMFGAATLGTYNISYEFANLPTTELGAPINRALLPGFAKMESGDDVASAYRNAIGLLAWLALPVAAGLFAVAPFFVPVVLGTKWLDAVPLMRALALNGVVLMLQASMCTVLIGRGFPARVAAANIIYVIVLLPMLGVFALQFGIVGVAYAALLSGVVCTPMYLWQIQRSIQIRPSVFLRAIWRPALASLGMVAIVVWALPAYTVTMSLAQTAGWLLVGISIGAGVYLVLASVLWVIAGKPAGPERVLIERASALLPGRRR
ncbi:MAG TPA: lipopolysaccharide biosynthesis protein [Burkholderiaceae bacterium]